VLDAQEIAERGPKTHRRECAASYGILLDGRSFE
jgi:hypothetical protein